MKSDFFPETAQSAEELSGRPPPHTSASTSDLLAEKATMTPPSPNLFARTASIFSAQARAIEHLADLYATDKYAQQQYHKALTLLHDTIKLPYPGALRSQAKGKIVLTGVGKSHKIADKLVATLNSLGCPAACLHPVEALHGDLGIVGPHDCLVMITASGNTPELMALLPHLPSTAPRITLTCNMDSPLARISTAVLWADLPSHLSEKSLYGLAAPTISTTLCLLVGDAVAISLAEMMVEDLTARQKLFGRFHPGGAIGKAYLAGKAVCDPPESEAEAEAEAEVDSGPFSVTTEPENDTARSSPLFSTAAMSTSESASDFDRKMSRLELAGTTARLNRFPETELELLRVAAGRKYIILGDERVLKCADIYDAIAAADADEIPEEDAGYLGGDDMDKELRAGNNGEENNRGDDLEDPGSSRAQFYLMGGTQEDKRWTNIVGRLKSAMKSI